MPDKEEILQSMLEEVSNELDKRPGSFIYDSLAPAASEFAKSDDAIDAVKDKLSIENLSGDELAQQVQERTGITRRLATRAIGVITVTGTGTIQIGDLFETLAGTQFRAIEVKAIVTSGDVAIEAVIPGSSGIVASNTITLFPVTLAGFTAVNNAAPTQDGFDAESDADLLQRYYERIQAPATSGNKAHYILWAKEVSGVGLPKIFPLWDGNNTVKVVIIDANRQPASTELVATVQEYLDPGIQGLGEGSASIGAFVTVESATGLNVNIAADIVLSAGFTKEQADVNIEASLTQYLFDIAFVENIVSYAKTGAAILASAGVEDYSGLTVNLGTSNITITAAKVAVLGTVVTNVS